MVGIAGHGLHLDREWSAAYESGKRAAPGIDVPWAPEVHRPSRPLQQLAALVPGGSVKVVADGSHDFWATDPELWRTTCTTACDHLR